MIEDFNRFKSEENAIENVIEIDKQIKDEFSKGSNIDGKKITKLRFEQMLRGLYITQNPII